jgi:hypothetical protein
MRMRCEARAGYIFCKMQLTIYCFLHVDSDGWTCFWHNICNVSLIIQYLLLDRGIWWKAARPPVVAQRHWELNDSEQCWARTSSTTKYILAGCLYGFNTFLMKPESKIVDGRKLNIHCKGNEGVWGEHYLQDVLEDFILFAIPRDLMGSSLATRLCTIPLIIQWFWQVLGSY